MTEEGSPSLHLITMVSTTERAPFLLPVSHYYPLTSLITISYGYVLLLFCGWQGLTAV